MKKYSARRGEKPNKTIRKATLETLEGRTCMSATIGLSGGVLTLQAEANTASALMVQLAGYNHDQVRASIGNNAHTYALNQVKTIVITGSQKNDWIFIDPRLGLPASITGGAGDDTIRGGTGFDTIDAGDGNDLIYAHGNIFTGNGNDTVWGSDKGDSIVAGSGNDLLVGGKGNDTILGGAGRDTIIGGQGSDKLIAGSGDTVIIAGWGDSTLAGGSGNDTLNGGGGGNHLLRGTGNNTINPGWHDSIEQAPGDSTEVTSRPTPVPPTVQVPPVTKPPIVPPVQVPTQLNTPAADGTQAVISEVSTQVIAGEGVSVNGVASPLGAGTILNATYQWDFGDPSGRHNNFTGWNAGHVYDNPGVYTITLTITDVNRQTSTAASTVTVAADNRPVIYVDTNGSDSNSGQAPNQAVRTAARALALAGGNTKIEFHRDQRFQVNQTLMINGNDVYVGAYGSGANPVLVRGAGDGSVTIFLTNSASNVTVQGLTFDSIYPAVNGVGAEIPVVGVYAQGTNVVVRDCTFLNVEDAIEGNYGLNGVIVQDSSAPLQTGLRGYFCWVDGTNWTIVGNTVVNTTRQHVVRGNDPTIDSIEIADNDFAKTLNPQDPQETMKNTINFRGGAHIYVTGNTLRNGTFNFGPDDYGTPDQNISWIVLENNLTTGQLILQKNVHDVMVRNNVLNVWGTAAIYIKPNDPLFPGVRYDKDITITHNTGLNDATGGQFLYVSQTALPGIITLTDNLYVAPNLQTGVNMSGGVLVDSPDLSAFSLISGNVWPAASGINRDVPGAVNYAYGSWYTDQGWLTADQWNARSQVRGDMFQNVLLAQGVYSVQTQSGGAGAAGYTPL